MDQYQCFECGMVSEELVQMKSNMDTAHAIKVDSEMIVRKFPCSLCNYTTTSMEEYKNHLITIHNKEKHNWMVEEIIASFLCEECDTEFPSSSLLMSHKDMIHRGKRWELR